VRIGPSAGMIALLVREQFDERVEAGASPDDPDAGFEVRVPAATAGNDTAAKRGRWLRKKT